MTNEMKSVPELRFLQFDKEWEKTTIADIGDFYYGRSAPKWSITDDATIPCVRYGELYTKHKGTVKEIYSYTNIDRNKLRFSKGGEILIPRVGEDPMDFAKCSYLPFSGIAIGEMISVYNTDQNPVFITAYFNSQMKYEFAKRVEGASVSNLYYSYLKDINLRIPTIEEQQKIGVFFSKLDRQIELEEQKLSLLEEQKKGYMQKIFSQELRFKNENGNNYPDWEVKKIGEIMDVASVKRIHQSDWTNEGVKFIRARDIVSRYKGKIVENPLFISKERYEEYSKLSGKVKIGDLLVTGVGTIGVPLLINNEKPIYFKDGNIIWLKNEDNIDKNFLFYSFISRKTQNFIKSVAGIGTVGTYTISNAKKTPILLPVSIEQVKIGNFFNELDKSIKKQNKKVDLLKERKKGFLQKMFI